MAQTSSTTDLEQLLEELSLPDLSVPLMRVDVSLGTIDRCQAYLLEHNSADILGNESAQNIAALLGYAQVVLESYRDTPAIVRDETQHDAILRIALSAYNIVDAIVESTLEENESAPGLEANQQELATIYIAGGAASEYLGDQVDDKDIRAKKRYYTAVITQTQRGRKLTQDLLGELPDDTPDETRNGPEYRLLGRLERAANQLADLNRGEVTGTTWARKHYEYLEIMIEIDKRAYAGSQQCALQTRAARSAQRLLDWTHEQKYENIAIAHARSALDRSIIPDQRTEPKRILDDLGVPLAPYKRSIT